MKKFLGIVVLKGIHAWARWEQVESKGIKMKSLFVMMTLLVSVNSYAWTGTTDGKHCNSPSYDTLRSFACGRVVPDSGGDYVECKADGTCTITAGTVAHPGRVMFKLAPPAKGNKK
jgi:hypothetical protein